MLWHGWNRTFHFQKVKKTYFDFKFSLYSLAGTIHCLRPALANSSGSSETPFFSEFTIPQKHFVHLYSVPPCLASIHLFELQQSQGCLAEDSSSLRTHPSYSSAPEVTPLLDLQYLGLFYTVEVVPSDLTFQALEHWTTRLLAHYYNPSLPMDRWENPLALQGDV